MVILEVILWVQTPKDLQKDQVAEGQAVPAEHHLFRQVVRVVQVYLLL